MIKQHNAKFIREKSGFVFAKIHQLILRGIKYAPLTGRVFKELPEFLKSKKTIINIQNRDNRCFGYSILYFLDRPNSVNHFERPSLYTDEMFENNNLANLPYPISPNDVNLYEDQLGININVFSFYDDEGKARHPLYIS